MNKLLHIVMEINAIFTIDLKRFKKVGFAWTITNGTVQHPNCLEPVWDYDAIKFFI